MMAAKPTRRAAYTLLELVVSLPVSLLLMMGLAASVYLASRAMPDSDTITSATLGIAGAHEQLASDLRYATALSKVTATEIIMTVPDRDGDAGAETIRYVWSGTAGAPLLRQVNGSALETLLPAVNSLQFAATTHTVGSQQFVTSIDLSLTLTAGGQRFDSSQRLYNEPLLPP